MMAPSVVDDRRTRRRQRYIWDSLDKAPEERRFLLKLDIFLFGFSCLGWSGAVVVYGDDLTSIERILLEVSRSVQYQQRFRVRDVGESFNW